MKKYYQAALALTAALSLIALLFYRHEYNKLRFVLQVFNYFGTPVLKPNNTCTTQFEDRQSAWQRFSNDLYIYSAYNYNNEKITSIVFGKNLDKLDFNCNILFSDELEPITGKFTYQKVHNNNNNIETDYDKQFSVYLFDCKYDDESINKTAVGIQFFESTKNHNDFYNYPITPVYTFDNNIDKSKNVICVSSSTSLLKYIDMIAFLAFHDYIGWNNFIVYDHGISPILNDALKNIARTPTDNWSFKYTTLLWNFPYPKVSTHIQKHIIELDCLYRNYRRASLALTLSWNEYVNLKYHTSIENLIFDIGKVTGKVVDKFQSSIAIHCTDQSDEDLIATPMPMVLRKTHLQSMHQNQSCYIYKLNNILNNYIEQSIDDLMIINRYQRCKDIYNNKQAVDPVLRFNEYIVNSKLYQLFVIGKLFSNNL